MSERVLESLVEVARTTRAASPFSNRARLSSILVILFALSIPRAALAHAPRRIGTATRLVVEFSQLEQNLDRAIQHHDAAALGGMLADDFEEWTPAPPGDPIPREDWLKHALDPARAVRSTEIRQVAVRTVDHAEVVSFVETQRASCAGRDCSSSAFVVDLWREATNPTLLIRYRSELPAREAAPRSPKPTGRE